MTELEEIIQRMIDAGESEDNIKAVVQSYENQEVEVADPVKTEAVATETASVTAVEGAVDTDLKSTDGSSEPQKILANGGIVSMYDSYLNDQEGKPTSYNVDNAAGQFIIDKVAGFTAGAAGLLGGAADGVEMLADVGAQKAIDIYNYFSDDDFSKEEREAVSGIIEQSFTLDDALNIAAAEAAKLKTVRDDDDGVGILGALQEGNYLEALDRTISGVFEAAPSVVAAFSGPIGLGIIGASSTGQHYEEKSQMEPEKRGLAMMGWSTVQGGIELASEVVTRGIFKGVGKMALMEGKALAKSAIGRLSTAMFFEGTSEVASQEANNVIDKIYSDGKIDKFYDKDGNFDTTNVLNRVFDTYLISAALGGGIQGGVELTGRQKALQADRMMSPKTQSQNLKLQEEITALEEANKGVDNKQQRDIINREKAKLRRKNNINFDIVESFTKEEKIEYLNVLEQNLDLQVEAKNGNLSEEQAKINKQLKERNDTKLNNIYETKAGELVQVRKANTLSFAESAESIGIKSTALNKEDYVSSVVSAVDAQRKAIKDDNSLSPEQKSKAIEDLPDGTPKSISEGSGAYFVGGEFFINEEMLDKIDQLNVGAHETLHPILNTIIGNSKEQGNLIEKFKKNLSKEQRDLVDLNMKDRGYTGAEYNTEYLTVFSDAIADKEIAFEENLFTKVGDYLMPLFRAVGFKKIKFKTGKDVFNFMREYSKSAEKGVISKDIKNAILEKTDGKGVGSIDLSAKKPKDTNVDLSQKESPKIDSPINDSLKENESVVLVKKDAKDRTITYTKQEKTSKNGDKVTDFSFNRNDKNSDQRSGAFVEESSALENTNYDIDKENSGFESELEQGESVSYEIKQIREGDTGAGATVRVTTTYKDGSKSPTLIGEVKLKPKSTEKISMSKSVTELNTDLDSLNDREFEMDQGTFDSQKANLEFKIKQAEKKAIKAPVEAKNKKATTLKAIKEISTSNKKIASENESIVDAMNSLGANKVSDIKNPKDRAKIVRRITENNIGAVKKLAIAAANKDVPGVDANDKISYEEFYSGFSAELAALVNTYESKVTKEGDNLGKKVPFGAYMAPNLAIRYGQILDAAKKGKVDNSSSLSDERTSQLAGSVAVDNSSSKSGKDVKLIKASRILNPEQLTRAKKIVLDSKIDPKSLSYKKLKGLTSEITSEITGVPAGKINNPAKNLSQGETTAAAMFISKNVDYIRNTLPEGAVLEGASEGLIGTSTGVPQKMLDAFYVRGKRGDNLSPFILRKGLTSNEILEEVGRPKGGKLAPIDPRSPRGSVIKGIIDIVDRNITNELVRTEKDLTQQEKIDTGAGRGAAVFSKARLKKENGETLELVSGARNIQQTQKVANIKNQITVNDSNRENRQKSVIKHIVDAFIPSVVLEAAMFGNSGRWYRKGKIVKGKFIPLPTTLGGVKYYKKRDGTLIKEDSSAYKKALKDGDFTPSKGGLYYGTSDPKYIEALKAAKENDYLYENLKKAKRVTPPKTGVTADFIKSKKDISKENMDTLESFAYILQDAVHKYGMPIEDAALFIASSYQATSGLIKLAAPFKYVSRKFEYSLIGKSSQRIGNKYREEHNPPASVIGSNLIWAIANNKVGDIMPYIKDNYYQTQLSKKDDAKLDDAKLDSILPKGYSILDNSVIRLVKAGIDLNSIIDPVTGETLAEINNVGIPESDYNSFNEAEKFTISTYQNKLIVDAIADADVNTKKLVKEYLKLVPSIAKASESNNNSLPSSIQYSKNITIQEGIDALAKTDKALDNARRLDAPVKKIRVFDFDDTLAQTKSNVLYTMPDGTEGKIDAATFAKEAGNMEAEGAVWDFSEFSKVMDGKKGPLFEVAKTIANRRGADDVFVLTARPANSAGPIKEFLASIGLNIPLKNITGLGDGAPQAKAGWIMGKAAEGYNDFYFADDSAGNVDAVKNALNKTNVKSKVQLAKPQFSLSSKQDLKWKQTDDAIETNFKVGERDFKMTLEETAFMEFDEGKTYQDIEDIAKELGISEDKDGDGIESSERFFHYEFGDAELGKDITGTGNALEVFSVAGNGLVDYLAKKKKIEGVIFTAKEPSRIRLYKTLGQALADKVGGSFGYKNNTFIISKKPLFSKTSNLKNQPKAVKDVLSVLDVKSKTQQDKIQFSNNIDKEFNSIIENKTGIAADKNYASVKAALVGKKKGRFDFFIPPSAEDFLGLLYKTLGKGKTGDAQLEWYKKHLLNPYARAMESISRDRNALSRNFRALKKELKVIPKDLKKKVKDSEFTREQAVRVYIWNQVGKDVPGLSKSDLKELVDMVKSDANLELFAQEVMKLNKGRAYTSPKEGWVSGTITTDLLESLNTTGRKQYLELWQQNVDTIFSEKNLNKMEAAYGKSYRLAMENILGRMKTGRNRSYGTDNLTGRLTDWLTGSIGAIMFFNTRSAVLQTLSAVNFINFGDNNIFAAGKAFANQKQYWSDFSKLWSSDFLIERRDGLKINVNEADIADIAKENGIRGVINKLLKLGFTPTQVADSFAIASGGATFYRNRVKSLTKEGMDITAAEGQAMRDFRETAEESQQSSRPDKISQQQAGPLGRVVLAFANTPAQYARLIKKSASDLKNGRGDAKTNLSKILYYGIAQNLLFNAAQQALFAIAFDEEEEVDKKQVSILNGMVDSVARGTGMGGAIFTVVKNASMRLFRENEKKNPKYEEAALELLKISPPISSKVQKLRSAGRTASWNMKDIKNKGFSLDNPAYLAGGNVVSAATNVPLDRVIKKLNNVVASGQDDIALYKRIALLSGWSEWELGLSKGKTKKSTGSSSRRRSKRRSGPERR